jgi:hypothetical protein
VAPFDHTTNGSSKVAHRATKGVQVQMTSRPTSEVFTLRPRAFRCRGQHGERAQEGIKGLLIFAPDDSNRCA